MGLFDKFMKKSDASYVYKPLNENEAWIGILFASVSADGEINQAELESLSRMLIFKKKFYGMNLNPLFKNVIEAKQKVGSSTLIDACATMIAENEKPTLFSMAVEIVLADGVIEEDEKRVIEYIAQAMKIDMSLVEKIIEVMLIRNQGNHILK